jgi:hypothetical protein
MLLRNVWIIGAAQQRFLRDGAKTARAQQNRERDWQEMDRENIVAAYARMKQK